MNGSRVGMRIATVITVRSMEDGPAHPMLGTLVGKPEFRRWSSGPNAWITNSLCLGWDLMRTYVIPDCSKLQDHGCRFSPPVHVLSTDGCGTCITPPHQWAKHVIRNSM